MKLDKDLCSAWISRTSAEIFFAIDWHDKRLKNTTDILLFYGEHFYGFSESDVDFVNNLMKHKCTNFREK